VIQECAQAFPYLRIQKGHLRFTPDAAFWPAYGRIIAADYATIRDHLPPACARLYDIGGGMGGIDIAIADHYRRLCGSSPQTVIVDGLDDAALSDPDRHRPFSSAAAARAFLAANGVEDVEFMAPQEATAPAKRDADLILSLTAYCFHFPPRDYLAFMRATAKPGAHIILDVRRGRKDWEDQVADAFKCLPRVIWNGHIKARRVLFTNRAPA
jgi:SAM-dependent methyltransferase